ncbi:MAG: cytochrome P450 [Caulobacteraceae bacterium]
MSALTVDERLAPSITGAPVLVGARPQAAPRTWAEKRLARREQLFPGIPDRAFDEAALRVGSIYGGVLINDPAGIKRVLVDEAANYPKTDLEKRFFSALFGTGLVGSDGDLWRRHRRIMAPSFDPRSVAAYGPAICESAGAALARWNALGEGGRIDACQEMVDLTLHIICRTMFSTDSEEMLGHMSASLRDGLDGVGEGSILDLLPVIAELRMRAREKRIARGFAPLDGAIAKLIARREANSEDFPADLLSRLVASKDSDTGLSMTAQEVRDEVITIFFAGHETTAMTLGWLWYLLSQHPHEGARLHAELDRVLGGRPPAQEDLPALKFTRQVVEEALRLYPAAPGLSTRRALKADELAGLRIKKGETIFISPWIVHRNTRLWEDPERFDPDRFSPERSQGRPRFAFLPFGGGPRVCIGQVLAMNEAVLIMASLAQHWRAELASDAEVALKHNVTLQPRHGLPMILRRR